MITDLVNNHEEPQLPAYQRVLDHTGRVSRHFGRGIQLGAERYKLRGYISNIADFDSTHEPEMRIVFERLLLARGAFIDVGVNLGQTLGKVLAIDRDREYLGFEPQIAACFFVSKFLVDNGIHGAHVLPFGLSSANSLRKFWSQGDVDTMASLYRSSKHTTETIVPTRVGDEVITELEIREIAAIKIDVEGAELEVLHGLRNTLKTIRPPVVFEVVPNFEGSERIPVEESIAHQRNLVARKIERLWRDLGYRIFQIDECGDEHFIDKFELDNTKSYRGLNFLARPGDLALRA